MSYRRQETRPRIREIYRCAGHSRTDTRTSVLDPIARHLGELLADSGRLPDADLVYFFDRAELPRVVGEFDITELVQCALQRRDGLPFQQSLEFDDVSIGRPAPVIARPQALTGDQVSGRPASRGIAEGTVRVAKSIHDAREVQRGEILVAPVTDVGWPSYFTVIAALVTVIGSSVSHGAVVARESGFPALSTPWWPLKFSRPEIASGSTATQV